MGYFVQRILFANIHEQNGFMIIITADRTGLWLTNKLVRMLQKIKFLLSSFIIRIFYYEH